MKKNNLKKNDLIKNLSKKKGFSKLYSKKIIENLILTISSNIKKKSFNLKNIGTFRLIKKKERMGRNPKTKENFKINARNSISFVASKKLMDNIFN
ncbi:HU family DNA-binding protein [Pelagibacteraceae bacterium]|nr:HU family DNA-binding protein [Pelagibacteraceae bacterium]